jgi:hypothetical protein
VQVKDNQPTLHQRIQEVSATTTPLGPAHSHDTGRNRDEHRTVTVFDPANRLADTDWHGHIAAVIRVERNVYTRNAQTGLLRHSTETAFYVANTPVTAARAANAIRAHWKVENTSHYTRDVTLGGAGKGSDCVAGGKPAEGKTARASAPTPACSPDCAVSPSTSSRQTGPTPSARTATARLSPASTTYSHSPPSGSVEQPCL